MTCPAWASISRHIKVGPVARIAFRCHSSIGDIYGRSGLSDSDDLIHGGPVQNADLTVRCSSGSVELKNGQLEDGRALVPLNAPIDLLVSGWTPQELRGRAADGRSVILRIDPLITHSLMLPFAMGLNQCKKNRRLKSTVSAAIDAIDTDEFEFA